MKPTKTHETGLSQTGQTILDALRKTWGKIEVQRQKLIPDDDGHARWVAETVQVDHPNKKLNAGVPAKVFHQFAGMVTPDDQYRILTIIDQGKFDVVQAIQVFEIAPQAALDTMVKPSTWEQADQMNTPTLGAMVKYKGGQKTAILVMEMLARFCRKFGKRNDMTDDLLQELSLDIVNQYRTIRIAEIKLILNNALKTPVRLFNLDYQGIISLFESASIERMNHYSQAALDRHHRITDQEKQTRSRNDDMPSGQGMTISEQINQIKIMNDGTE